MRKPQTKTTIKTELWKPIIEETNQSLKITLTPHTTLIPQPPTQNDLAKIHAFLERQIDFKLVGFSHLLNLTGSFCLSYLVFQDELTPEKGWYLANLHEKAQQRIWGEDKESVALELHQRKEFLETVRFLRLIE